MSERRDEQQNELVQLIKRYSSEDGCHATCIPSLFVISESHVTEPVYSVYKPSFCLIVQGEKEVLLAKESFKYGPGDYLVASLDLPVTGQVINASSNAPYLALKLEFTPSQILEILDDATIQVGPEKRTNRAMFVSQVETSLLDAVVRLARLLDNPNDIPVLAPIFTKEILYRVLQGSYGRIVEQMAIEGSYTYHIREVIEFIKKNYNETIRIEELAEIANMSVSTLHRHFKEITAMSPIQFQKHIKLQEARRILLSEATDAADVAFRVGYESPSQFSREYSRMFGFPPKEDITRLRNKYEKRMNA